MKEKVEVRDVFGHRSRASLRFFEFSVLWRLMILLPLRLWLIFCTLLPIALVSVCLPSRWDRKIAQFLVVRCSRFLLFILGIRTTIQGQPQAQYTLVSNHVSYLDVLALSTVQQSSFVAKEGVAQTPLLGTLAKMYGCIFVPSPFQNGISNIRQVIDRITTYQHEMVVNNKRDSTSIPPLVVFAEGTTSNGTALLQFRRGAFVAGLPIQPVAIRYSPASSGFDPCWESVPIWWHIIHLLSSNGIHIHVYYGNLVIPTEKEKKQPILYANRVQKVQSQMLQIPRTQYGLREKLAFHQRIIQGEFHWLGASLPPDSEY